MIDLTPYLKLAHSWRDEWSCQAAREFASQLSARYPDWQLEWDEWAGEEWLSWTDSEVVALLHTKVPLLLVRTGCFDEIQNAGLVVCPMEHYDARLRVERPVYEQAFALGSTVWEEGGYDSEALTPHDIWFMTV